MDTVEISRFLTAMTLAVHIIFATIGVGMPLMFAIAEFLGIRKNDLQYIAMAKRWAKAYTITVAVGVVTGTNYRTSIIINLAYIYGNGWTRYCTSIIYGNICVLL